ncbi:MAG: TIM barrel protein [Candidatus Diapherotrites archaeon]|nr:TIM barrel protein [Candidatus Diapherotrites archaeon]
MKTRISFATAGVPHSSKKTDTVSGLGRIKELGLDGMELEFVHGVRMGKETADTIRETATRLGLSLSVHGPYYINLNAVEPEKRSASVQRIFDSAKVGAWCGAQAVTFHPAYVMKDARNVVAKRVQTALEDILSKMDEQKIAIAIKPETTGKGTQFGSLTELLDLYRQNPRIRPNVDFSHLHARDNGRFKTKEDFGKALDEMEKCDPKLLKDLHMHVAGIAYTAAGERNHLVLQDPKNDFNYKWLLETLHEYDVQGRIACESPNIEEDALLMKHYYETL